jgi:hypothetical protein
MSPEANAYVYQATLAEEALAGLLQERFPKGAFALVRRVDGIDFVRLDPGQEEALLRDWPEGQVFGPEADLRWRRADEGCAVLLLTEDETPPRGLEVLREGRFVAAAPAEGRGSGFLLWGTRQKENGEWWEARIPRPLRYPVRTSDRPLRLVYLLYRDPEGMAVRWVRLMEVREDAK